MASTLDEGSIFIVLQYRLYRRCQSKPPSIPSVGSLLAKMGGMPSMRQVGDRQQFAGFAHADRLLSVCM